jgi:hypothetical protein
VPPSGYPEYLPSGEMRLGDSHGYSVTVAYWDRTNRNVGKASKGTATATWSENHEINERRISLEWRK